MDIRALQAVLLAGAQARSVDSVLSEIVHGLAGVGDLALARIWLMGPGDSCSSCRMAKECRDRRTCLHLKASAGNPLAPNVNWDGTEGAFRRFPVGIRKVGVVASTGEGLLIKDLPASAEWVARPEWAREERVLSFAGQPLSFHGEVLGVLGVFSRSALDEDAHDWLRTFADHAAVALANAKAYQEIARLRERLEEERDYLRAELAESHQNGEIVGQSPALLAVMQKVQLVASTDSNVLILGESGTGKELVARAIHDQSARSDGPLVRVNCASVPKELFESEFFGHVRGSYTGAHRDRTGRFDLADGGTLLLDEVGEIPLELQGKLLRVLQEGSFERVGDEKTRTVNVRVLAATNRDLEDEVQAGRFRQDLFYRLSVFPIQLPPLRDRREDIGPLAAHFLAESSKQLNRTAPRLTKGQVKQLEDHAWRGNIRELQNVIERAVILSSGPRLALEFALPELAPAALDPGSVDESMKRRVFTDAEVRRLERDNIIAALEETGGKVNGVDGAAELLGMKPSTLTSRMKSMKIPKSGKG